MLAQPAARSWGCACNRFRRELGMEKHKTGKTLHKPRRKSVPPSAKYPGLKKPASGHELSTLDLPVLLLYNIDPAWEPPEQDEAMTATQELIEALRQVGHPVTPVQVNDLDLRRFLSFYNPEHFIVLNWCEALPGISHSEALAAETLEEMGFAYSGSPPPVLRLSGDKEKVKDVLRCAGVPTPLGCVCPTARHVSWDRFPAIVKPVREHCSIGITPEAVVLDKAALIERITFVTETYRQPALVEEFIDGREFRVTLWGNKDVEMLPPVEMEFSAFSDLRERLCSWDAKFTPGSRHYTEIRTVAPAPLTTEELRLLEDVSQAAYRAMEIRDYARFDFRLRDGIFYLLDPNPNPDISSDASLALTAELAGYSYGRMGSQLVRLAAARHPVFGKQAQETKDEVRGERQKK
jgi:D-alanine-D-alanine ligase